ncbi:hypothetical protein Hanom_Chr05g00473631 [Helianthus anomalus]
MLLVKPLRFCFGNMCLHSFHFRFTYSPTLNWYRLYKARFGFCKRPLNLVKDGENESMMIQHWEPYKLINISELLDDGQGYLSNNLDDVFRTL